MDSISSVSPSLVLPHSNPIHAQLRRFVLSSRVTHGRLPRPTSLFGVSVASKGRKMSSTDVSCNLGSEGNAEGEGDEGTENEERVLQMDGTIPGTSNEFVKRVSSRAYDMRRHLRQSFDSSCYDVLDSNPWRETSKPVYVLTQRENQLSTMKTRKNRSKVERELGLLFSKGANWRSGIGNQSKQSRGGTKFHILVEDIR